MDLTKLKPYELIRVAIHDLEICERDPRYFIRMGTWHSPANRFGGDTDCGVCLAGAVMAMSLDCNHLHSFTPSSFSKDKQNVLCAIDMFRTGDVRAALVTLGLPDHYLCECRPIVPYEINRTQFIDDMLELADDLEDVGY